MREKKHCTVLAFYTTTDAIAMEKKCAEQSIPGRLIPIPRQITAGCGLAWRMTTEEYEQFRTDLEQSGIPVQQTAELLLY